MPGDRPLLELADVALEEVAAQPFGQGAAGQLLEQRLRALGGQIALLGAQAGAHAVGQGGFVRVGRERDDAVGVGPGGHRLAGLDLLGPAVAEQAQHEHGEAVFQQALLLRLAAHALAAQLLQQPVDADGVDLQLDAQLLQKGLGGDGDVGAGDDGFLVILFIICGPHGPRAGRVLDNA